MQTKNQLHLVVCRYRNIVEESVLCRDFVERYFGKQVSNGHVIMLTMSLASFRGSHIATIVESDDDPMRLSLVLSKDFNQKFQPDEYPADEKYCFFLWSSVVRNVKELLNHKYNYSRSINSLQLCGVKFYWRLDEA